MLYFLHCEVSFGTSVWTFRPVGTFWGSKGDEEAKEEPTTRRSDNHSRKWHRASVKRGVELAESRHAPPKKPAEGRGTSIPQIPLITTGLHTRPFSSSSILSLNIHILLCLCRAGPTMTSSTACWGLTHVTDLTLATWVWSFVHLKTTIAGGFSMVSLGLFYGTYWIFPSGCNRIVN